jgi:MFS family permease
MLRFGGRICVVSARCALLIPEVLSVADISEAQLAQRPPEVPLRRNVGFQLLWSGSVFSVFGLEITDLVYPLVVLAITGSPALAGAVGGVQIFTSLLLGLPAGELTDRYDRRTLVLIVESVRALSVASAAVALSFHRLTLVHLLVIAVITGGVRPISGASRMLLVRSLVPQRQLTSALTQEQVRGYGVSFIGPPVGGALYAVTNALPLVATAVSFVVSAVCTFFVRVPPGADAQPPGGRPTGSPLQRMFAGLTLIWRAPVLRRTTLFTTATNIVAAPLTLITVVHLQHQGVTAGYIGFATAGLAIGGLAGTVLVAPLHKLAPGVLLLAGAGLDAVLIPVFGLTHGPWQAAVVLFVLALAAPATRVLVDLMMFRRVSPDQRGRVMSAALAIWGLGASVGLFLTGWLLEVLSVRAATLVIGSVLAVLTLVALADQQFRSMVWPVDDEPEQPAAPAAEPA